MRLEGDDGTNRCAKFGVSRNGSGWGNPDALHSAALLYPTADSRWFSHDIPIGVGSTIIIYIYTYMMIHTGASSPGSKMISPIYTNPFHFVVQKPLFKVLLQYITVASSDLSCRWFFPWIFHGFFNGTMGRWSNLPRSSQGTLTLKSLDRLLSLAAPWRQRSPRWMVYTI